MQLLKAKYQSNGKREIAKQKQNKRKILMQKLIPLGRTITDFRYLCNKHAVCGESKTTDVSTRSFWPLKYFIQ